MANKCKYYKEKQQVSYDFGVTWLDTGEYRKGSLIEYQSSDCPPPAYENQYLTFRWSEPTASTYTNPVKLLNNSGETLSFSIDKGVTWSAMTHSAPTQPSCGANDVQYTDVTVSSGDTIWIKHTKEDLTNKVGIFATVCDTVEGNVMSLIYGDDFIGKTSLSGTRSIFSELFAGYVYCYEMDLKYAHNLVLPATLGYSCYASMFQNCIDLITTPILSATTLAEGCYSLMFSGCKSLTTLPELPATALAAICYFSMFSRCTSLTTVPTNYLPSTTLASQCYDFMFERCTSLTVAPQLPATTLAYGCYGYMFIGCTSLTTAPVLSATTLISQCYRNMFSGCTSLSSITCLATDISVSSSTLGWVIGVPSGGTFIRDCNTNWSSGDNGIPNGWTDNCIQPKFIATYSGGTTSSAECDSSSAITQNEVTKTDLVDVLIGDCVRTIESDIFSQCTSLTSVTIGSGVTSIGTYAFNNCANLTSITIKALAPPTLPNTTTLSNTNECQIYVPCESVLIYKTGTYWSKYASRIKGIPPCVEPTFNGKILLFYNQQKQFPSGIYSYSGACSGGNRVTSGNTRPERYTYTAITEAIVGECVTDIDTYAFDGCTNLRSIHLPSSITSIGKYAFRNCTGLTSIDIPNVTNIRDYAFQNCSGITNLDIPSGLTSIGKYAFDNCYGITNANIPSGVTTISQYAFGGCRSLTSVTIPNSVTSIEWGALMGCKSLTSVTIPSGVTSIGQSAFVGCVSLQSITCLPITPPTYGYRPFDNTNDCPIYVPAESVEAYKSAWGSSLSSRIQPIP